MWRKPWILQRPEADAYNGLIMDLFNTDEISYKYNFLRMDACAVEELFYKMEVNRGVTFVQKGGTAKRSVAKPNCDLRSSTEVDYDGK